jgi:hypothetical protein
MRLDVKQVFLGLRASDLLMPLLLLAQVSQIGSPGQANSSLLLALASRGELASIVAYFYCVF